MTAGRVDSRRGGTECSRVLCVVLSVTSGMTERLAVSLLTGLHWSIRDVSAWSYREGSIRQHGRVFCEKRNRLRNRKQQEGPTCCRQDRDRLPSHCRSSVRPKLFVPSCLQSQTFTSLPGQGPSSITHFHNHPLMSRVLSQPLAAPTDLPWVEQVQKGPSRTMSQLSLQKSLLPLHFTRSFTGHPRLRHRQDPESA